MRRCLTQVGIAVAAMSFSLPALAQTNPCPPGAWFCADAQVVVPGAQAAQPAPRAVQPPPPAEEEPAEPAAPAPAARRPRYAQPRYAQPAGPPPPVVVYQPYQPLPAQPPQVIIVTPGYGPYGYGYGYGRPMRSVPPPPNAAVQPRWHSEFGLNLRVEGMTFGHGGNRGTSSGMGGVGMSLRYRPVPAFAFDLGVDLLAGNDYNGYQRTEVPISLSGMLYLNPRSRVQVYLQGGANFSRAQVRADANANAPQLQPVDGGSQLGATYTYFGGQGGGGFEFRLSRRVALNLDAIGFVRKRIGDTDTTPPEFTDRRTDRTTNTSGGALFRGGLTFWW